MAENFRLISAEKHKKSKIGKYIACAAAAVVAAGGIMAAAFSESENDIVSEAPEVQTEAVTDLIPEETAAESISETFISSGAAKSCEAAENEYNISVKADGETITVEASADSTVEEILDSADITLNEHDILQFPEGGKLYDGAVISVSRVEYVTNTKTYSVDYEIVYQTDDELPEGERVVSEEGEEGEVLVETRSKVVDGRTTDVEIVSETVIKPAVDKVILTGTMKTESGEEETSEEQTASSYAGGVDPNSVERVSLFDIPDWLILDENGVPVDYVDTVTGKSCAYTAKPDALMSTGKTVFQGYVAVDPKIIPYGSELYIIAEDGSVYGYAIAADTGYSVRAGHIVVDLFMNEYDDCIQWGNRKVTIYVLRRGE